MVDFLRRVTAPRVVLCEFALLEMTTELTYRHRAGIHWPGTGIDFRDQSYYSSPRSILVRVLLDGAKDFLMVMTLAVRTNLRPAKLPNFRTSFATVSFYASLSSCTAVAEQQNLRISRVE